MGEELESGLPAAARPRIGEYRASMTAAWRVAAELGAPAMALVPASADLTGPDTLVVRWANAHLLNLLGLRRTELIGRTLPDLPTDGPGSLVPVLRRALRDQGDDLSASVRGPDGNRLTVRLELGSLQPESAGWLVRVMPVTDDEQAGRTALREAEHRFRALAEHAPVGIFMSEAGARLGYVNERFAETFGRDPASLAGTLWLDCVHPEDQPGLYEAIESVLGGGQADLSVRLAPDGEHLRWVHLRLAPTTTASRSAGFIGTAEDITDRRAREERLFYQARHDVLTGLVNRRRLAEVLAELLGSQRHRDHRFALLLLDLDGFKDVNDSYGHEAGDRVLVDVARRLQRAARRYDVLARVAGDEFVVVLQDVDSPMAAEAAARRFVESLSAPFVLGSGQSRLSASIGIALAGPGDTPESLLRSADRAMYQAKAEGSGRYRIAAGAVRSDQP